MLQRIQTVFLILVVILMTASLFLPLWIFKAEDSSVYFGLYSFYYEHFDPSLNSNARIFFPYSLVATLAVASITVTIIEITKFSNRLVQMKLGALNSLLMAGTMCLGVWFATKLMEGEGVAGTYGYGLFLPGAAMIFNILANRFIRKDERLVRSVDRIR